jgi:hypothetical protein
MANGVKTFLFKKIGTKIKNKNSQHIILSRCAMTKMQYVTT